MDYYEEGTPLPGVAAQTAPQPSGVGSVGKAALGLSTLALIGYALLSRRGRQLPLRGEPGFISRNFDTLRNAELGRIPEANLDLALRGEPGFISRNFDTLRNAELGRIPEAGAQLRVRI